MGYNKYQIYKGLNTSGMYRNFMTLNGFKAIFSIIPIRCSNTIQMVYDIPSQKLWYLASPDAQ